MRSSDRCTRRSTPWDIPAGTRFYSASISLGPFMACILGNVDNDFVPEIVGELSNRTVAL
jgi:hypothetical protein